MQDSLFVLARPGRRTQRDADLFPEALTAHPHTRFGACSCSLLFPLWRALPIPFSYSDLRPVRKHQRGELLPGHSVPALDDEEWPHRHGDRRHGQQLHVLAGNG